MTYSQIIYTEGSNHFDREAIGLILFDEKKEIHKFKRIEEIKTNSKLIISTYGFLKIPENYRIAEAKRNVAYSNGLIQFSEPNPVASALSKDLFERMFNILVLGKNISPKAS